MTWVEVDGLVNAARENEDGPRAFVRRVESATIEKCAKLLDANLLDTYGQDDPHHVLCVKIASIFRGMK